MSRIAGWLMTLAALMFVGVLARGVVPLSPGRTGGADADGGRYFHPGKTSRSVQGGGDCLGPGCHDGASHRRDPKMAAFRNMHSNYVECLVCHAPDGLTRFEGRQAENGRRHLRYKGAAPPAGSKGHPALGAAAGCRKCHSDAGAKALKERGLSSLPSNYPDPIALRMMEGGGRRWNP